MAINRGGIVRSALGTTLLGLLLFRGSVSGPATPTPSGETVPKPPAIPQENRKADNPENEAAPSTKEIPKGPWIASRKHFVGIDGACSEIYAESPSSKSLSPFEQEWCIPPGNLGSKEVRAMIGIVPDPLQTHMSLSFDRAVEAIQLAAASMNYAPDYYWLPWDIEQKADWIDYESFKQATKVRKQTETQPGLLIFRWSGKAKETNIHILYVFLVSETPTAGVNGEQFAKATQYISLLNGKDDILIMGPTFSNSLKSFRGLVDAAENRHRVSITTYSGTVSNGYAIKAAGFTDPKTFQSFVRTTDEMLQAFVKRKIDKDDKDNDGKKSTGEDHKDNRCSNDVVRRRHPVALLSEAVTIGDIGDRRESQLCIDTFEYSREISSLRNAYSASPAQNPTTTGNTAEHPSLSLNLTDQTNSNDEPPDFSKMQSPLSKEAVLMKFAAQIRRNRYQYIGIITTSPLDAAFLTDVLRREVPNTRLFQMDSDALREHEPDYTSNIGTLSLTTYPLLDRRLNPTFENPTFKIFEIHDKQPLTYLPFETQFEEGQYNATICLLTKMLEIRFDQPGQLSERAECPYSKAPPAKVPVWLTTVGAGGHWPVEVIDGEIHPSPPPIKHMPACWKALSALLCVLALLHTLILAGLGHVSPKFRDFALGNVTPGRQLLGIQWASATLSLALILTGLSAAKLNLWTCWVGASLILLTATCLLLTRKYIRWRAHERSKGQDTVDLLTSFSSDLGASLILFLPPWILSILFAWVWWKLLHDTQGYYGTFFSYRAVYLTSIVSPLTPMLPLLTAVYLAAIFYVWHLKFHEKVRPRLNPDFNESGQDKLRPGWRSEPLIIRAMNDDLRNAVWAIGIFFIWLGIFNPFRFAPFERPGFQRIYGALLCIVVFLIVLSGYRLKLIWGNLRRLLIDLNRQRVRIVFSRLTGEDWTSLWFYGSEDADWDSMQRSEEIIQQLTVCSDSPAASWQTDEIVKTLRRKKRKLEDERFFERARFALGIREREEQIKGDFYDAQIYLAKVLHCALDKLKEVWRNQPPWVEEEDKPAATHGVIVHCDKKEADTTIQWQKLIEEYVAHRYEAFIRAVIARIRCLVIFLPLSFTLAMISLIIYPFEPHRELLWSLTALFMGIGFIMITVLIQMDCDPILSRITGTQANHLEFTFYVKIVTLGIGPLITLLATHYPSISRYIVSFLQPGLEALK